FDPCCVQVNNTVLACSSRASAASSRVTTTPRVPNNLLITPPVTEPQTGPAQRTARRGGSPLRPGDEPREERVAPTQMPRPGGGRARNLPGSPLKRSPGVGKRRRATARTRQGCRAPPPLGSFPFHVPFPAPSAAINSGAAQSGRAGVAPRAGLRLP